MIGFNKDFEQQCGEYLEYLYRLAEKQYNDCPDIDTLVQDTLTAFIIKNSKGENIDYPKGFLSAVLKNKYNAWLREKYKAEYMEYFDSNISETYDELAEKKEAERKSEEYESVRREIGRLIRIYREVTVRHYVHGQTVNQIAKDLGIPRGTVLSRLSAARDQIKEGLEKNMEKYSQISYEPKHVTLGIWGSVGLGGEPFSLTHTDLEGNILLLAYENPMSVRGISDTMGMPAAYVEQTIDKLVEGELMGRTERGLVYTRCFMIRYDDAFGDIPAQEELAQRYASRVWEIAAMHLTSLTESAVFAKMSDKQKATLILFCMNQALNEVLRRVKPNDGTNPTQPPDRPNGGRWLATATVFEHAQPRDNKYDGSGPLHVGNKKYRMFDFQSLFGDGHWAYKRFKYKCSASTVLSFYASFLPCGEVTVPSYMYELIPEFEKLHILKRDEGGEVRLDIPALTFDEGAEFVHPAIGRMADEYYDLLKDELEKLFLRTNNRVPKHVDEHKFFRHAGAVNAYVTAQLAAIVEQKLLPYPVTIGKTPIIYIEYKPEE